MLRFAVLTVVACVATGQLFPVPPRPVVHTETHDEPTTRREHGPFRPFDPTGLTPASRPENVDLVLVGVTSGNRNPDVFLTNDPNRDKWGEEGPGMLNNVGKREALGLGRALRQRYGHVITEQFFRTNFVSFSSTGESEDMTSQVVNTGIFPPVGRAVFDPSIQWQPVPVTTEDHLLGMTRVDRCPTVREALRPIINGELPEIRNVLNRERVVVDYVVRSTGITRNIEDLSEVAENLRQMRVRSLTFPDWVENPQITGFDRETLYHRIQVFRNAVEVACSVHEPCRRIVSGVLLNHMVETIRMNVQVRNNVPVPTTTDRRDKLGMVVYTGDVEVILSVFRVLNLDHFNVPTTGGFVLEVRTTDPTPTIRVVLHQPDPRHPETTRFFVPRRVPGTGRLWDCTDHFCPVEEFMRHVRPHVITDYRVACNDVVCDNLNPLVMDTVNKVSDYKVSHKRVDCTVVTDKYPESACRELARFNFCMRNDFVRNVVCRRTCHCMQFDIVENFY